MGFFDNLKSQLTGMFDSFTGANEDFFEELEETLILADLGVETATTAIERLREMTKEQGLRGADEIRDALRAILADLLVVGDSDMVLNSKPAVILVIGVNG
ncbi:MAG: signal recognition particle receptor subunit alpha, partial [Oscillospiraceae bacterium]|nr:signal recognition particle receptor subunit alpha [Oscillospiraceae bacterium]